MRYACMLALMCGCSDWSQVKNAHDVEGELVRVESKGKDTVTVDEVVLCDSSGFVFAGDSNECKDAPYDTRKDKVFKHEKDTKTTVGLIVVGVLTAVFTPVAIVGSAILSQGK